MIDIIILLIVVVFILVIVMKSGKVASSKEKRQEPTSQEPTSQGPTSHQADSQTPSPKEPSSQEPTSQEPTSQKAPRQTDSQTPSPKEPSPKQPSSKEPTSLQPNPQGPTSQEPSPKEPTSQEPTSQEPTSQAPSPEPSTLIPIDQIIRKFNKSSFGYHTNPINNNGETLSNLVSQYLHNKNKPRKLLLPIGSIIFTLIPLRKNEIGNFQQSGYLLQPITNVQNGISSGVASGVNNIAGKNVNLQTPKIVNRTIRGSKDNKISINEIQYGDNQPQQFISGMPYHVHSLDLPNQRQINMKVVHNSGAFRPGGQPFKYFLKGINKQQNMMKDGEDVAIDVRDKSNVFFFYMVVGYSSEDMGLGEPEDEDGDELF